MLHWVIFPFLNLLLPSWYKVQVLWEEGVGQHNKVFTVAIMLWNGFLYFEQNHGAYHSDETAELTLVHQNLPKLITFFQFQSPKWLSIVSRHEPGPISLVLDAVGLISAHPCSGASPSVRPTPWTRLKEKSHWHLVTWAGRWNLGTRNVISLTLWSTCHASGVCAILLHRCLYHWHAMSYNILSTSYAAKGHSTENKI